MNAHFDRIIEVHVSSQTHVAIPKPDNVVVDGFIASLLNLRQLDDGDVPLHSNKVLFEGALHVSPASNFSYRQPAVPMERRSS